MDANKDNILKDAFPFKKGLQKSLEKLNFLENLNNSEAATHLISSCKEAMLEVEPETKTTKEAIDNILLQLDKLEQKAKGLISLPPLEALVQKGTEIAQARTEIITACKKNILEIKPEDCSMQKALNDVLAMLGQLAQREEGSALMAELSLKKSAREGADPLSKTPSIDALLGNKDRVKKHTLPVVGIDLSSDLSDVILQCEHKISDIKTPNAAAQKSIDNALLALGRLKEGQSYSSLGQLFETKEDILDLVASCRQNILALSAPSAKVKGILNKAVMTLDKLQQRFIIQEKIEQEPGQLLAKAEAATDPAEVLHLVAKCRKLILGLKKTGGSEELVEELLAVLSKLKHLLIVLFRAERRKLIELHLAKLRQADEELAKKAEKQIEILRKLYINQPITRRGG